jgi:predicted enzyme related to lactoylglutathione lyase
VIQDPQEHSSWPGARAGIPAHSWSRPGACWNELSPTDPVSATAFYSGLFGWKIVPFQSSTEPYLSIKNGAASNGGIRPLNPPGAPPHWLVYFGVEDIDEALPRVQELGGAKHAGPIDIQMATIAIVADPEGAIFALYAGALEP